MSWLNKFVDWFMIDDAVTRAGKRAVLEAERLFATDITDFAEGSTNPNVPRWKAAIQAIINASGWTWVKYVGNTRDPKEACQWCGMFAAACWRAAGIDPKWLATFWASTARLDNWAKGEHWNGEPAGGPRPYIALTPKSKPADVRFPGGLLPRAGDILVVGDTAPKDGDHITLVVSYDDDTGTFHTINGNGGGLGPDGKRREGVVKTDYTLGVGPYYPLRVYRVLESDLKR